MGFLVFTLQRETLQSSHQLELLVSPESVRPSLTNSREAVSYACHSTREETPHEEVRGPRPHPEVDCVPGECLCEVQGCD